ncbi:branched-chain amino acid ABC transporter permease [Salinigranum rubrum]|uniref:Branched-chain amino acid ABC transporter permease n=1 Tax=Salinigranum rubrum TaxID=755307 RepID=A0A2I8VJE6_9EURY|nr:branched-chain amino acid ABC transporter permease [Salinigranum rubrum]AUV82040.1 branched-chain amino acid ABC transporter permease [Salinigranum rubrum]
MALPLVQELIFGLVLGSFIALGAIGFTLVYGLVNMINFAHGEFVTVGAYVGLIAAQFLGLPFAVAVVAALAVTAVFGWGVAQVTFEPLNDAGAVPLLLTSIGVGLILRNGIRLAAGASPQYIDTTRPTPYRFEELGFFFTDQQVFIVAITVVAVVALHLFLNRTMIGVAMRATSDNEDLALVTGIDTRRVRHVVWLIASAFAGVAGILLAVSRSANPSLGFGQLLLVLTAAILGGAGSPYGAVVGSYILGIGISLAIAFLPTGVSEFGTTMAFVVLIVVLLVRPGGIVNQEVRHS